MDGIDVLPRVLNLAVLPHLLDIVVIVVVVVPVLGINSGSTANAATAGIGTGALISLFSPILSPAAFNVSCGEPL